MYTAQQLIDEVKLRLARLNVSLELDDQTILTFINDARRQVQADTLGLREWAYTKWVLLPIPTATPNQALQPIPNPILGFTLNWYTVPLPADFIREVIVLLRYTWNNVLYRSEARYAAGLELTNVSIHSWNMPTPVRPVYTIERAPLLTGVIPVLHIAGLESAATNPPGQVVDPNATLELIYVAHVPLIEDVPGGAIGTPPDLDVNMPPDYFELVIWYAVYYSLVRMMARHDVIAVALKHIELIKQLIFVTAEEEKAVDVFIPSREPI